MKRTRADRRRAALLGWKTRVRGSKITASRTLIKRGERVRISWNAVGQSVTVGRVDVSNRLSGYKDLYPKQTTTYTLTARGYGQVSIRRVTVEVEEEKRNREYFVVLEYKGPKKTRLLELIVTAPDGTPHEEIAQIAAHYDEAYLALFESQGSTITIIPRDEPTNAPEGVIVNDARNKKSWPAWAKRKTNP